MASSARVIRLLPSVHELLAFVIIVNVIAADAMVDMHEVSSMCNNKTALEAEPILAQNNKLSTMTRLAGSALHIDCVITQVCVCMLLTTFLSTMYINYHKHYCILMYI